MRDTLKTIHVNHLPEPTWNRLLVNYARVELDSLKEFENTFEFSIENAQDVRIESVNTGDAVRFAASHTGGIRREAHPAGKAYIYQEQDFASGMGKEFTDLMERLALKTDIITLGEGQKLNDPLILKWDFAKSGRAASRHIIHAKKDSRATLILISESAKKAKGTAAIETKLILEEGADIRLIKVNLLSDSFMMLDDTAIAEADRASLEYTQMILGGGKTYTGCYADQAGRDCELRINSGYMTCREQMLDINYVSCIRGSGAKCRINVKGSLRGRASKTFRGTIDFRRGAKGAVGDEQEDVLLLDEGVVNKTMPVILTEEDDVDARHGSTIGNLAKEVLFYMGSRGIDRATAEMLITRGYLFNIANTIPDEETVRKINLFIKEAFERHECF